MSEAGGNRSPHTSSIVNLSPNKTLFSALPFPRLFIQKPWTHGGTYWLIGTFLRWPFPGQLTPPAERYFYRNQQRALGPF